MEHEFNLAILEETASFEDFIEALKKQSNYYPKIIRARKLYVTYYSTLVRIERDGKWYVVHCVESLSQTLKVEEIYCLMRLIESVHKIQHLYKITDGKFEYLDPLQESEAERLTKALPRHKYPELKK